MSRARTLVRYISPFGSPAWMDRAEAERYLAEDDARWLELSEISAATGCDLLAGYPRRVGPPRIEGLR